MDAGPKPIGTLAVDHRRDRHGHGSSPRRLDLPSSLFSARPCRSALALAIATEPGDGRQWRIVGAPQTSSVAPSFPLLTQPLSLSFSRGSWGRVVRTPLAAFCRQEKGALGPLLISFFFFGQLLVQFVSRT